MSCIRSELKVVCLVVRGVNVICGVAVFVFFVPVLCVRCCFSLAICCLFVGDSSVFCTVIYSAPGGCGLWRLLCLC